MNKKQFFVLVLMVLIIAATLYFGPKYKIELLDKEGKNFIKTKSGSSLYERCKSPVQFEWDKISKVLVPTILIGGVLIILLKTKKEKIN